MEERGLTALTGILCINTSTNDTRNETAGSDFNSEEAFSTISFGLGISIIAINIASLACLIRYRKCITATGFWQQLFFLCLSDILSGIAISIFTLGSYLSFIHPSVYYSLCVTGIFLFPISITLSVGTCCLISIQRYNSIKTIDQQNDTTWDRRTSVSMILGNVILSTITFVTSVVVVIIRFGFHPEQFCNMINITAINDYKFHYIIVPVLLLVSFLLCTNIVTVLSIIKMASITNAQVSNVSNSNSQLLRALTERNRYATKTFILIVIVLNVTTIPSLLFILVSAFSNANVSAEITEIVSRLMSMNSFFNPFIYTLRMHGFRNAIWNDMKAFWGRFKCSGGTV